MLASPGCKPFFAKAAGITRRKARAGHSSVSNRKCPSNDPKDRVGAIAFDLEFLRSRGVGRSRGSLRSLKQGLDLHHRRRLGARHRLVGPSASTEAIDTLLAAAKVSTVANVSAVAKVRRGRGDVCDPGPSALRGANALRHSSARPSDSLPADPTSRGNLRARDCSAS